MQQSYLSLPDSLYQVIEPSEAESSALLLFNRKLAKEIEIPKELMEEDAAEYFTGSRLLAPELCIALGYAGHQFGHYNPQLGDGRAHMLGQINGFDWQLKGSGITRYSRRGDGRCALGPAVREYIMSEAMQILGVPTMRTLAVATTGELLYRHQPQAGAVVSRIGRSHLRIGSFQYASAVGVVKEMADFAIEQLHPELAHDTNPYLALYRHVQANLIDTLVHWYRVGFIHGVMNTDNIALTGETFDFGPCAMLGDYKLAQVYSSIDQQGRYAFGNQKSIMQWNLARFAETLIPLVSDDAEDAVVVLTQEVESFSDAFQEAYDQMCANKLGFATNDTPLVDEFFELLTTYAWDYTEIFNQLYHHLSNGSGQLPKELEDWAKRWLGEVDTQYALELMKATNPKAVPRNHEVEALIKAAESGQESIQQQVDNYLAYLSGSEAKMGDWGKPDASFDRCYQTYCGT